ncbi:MAG: Zn-dependent hydrolase [Niastella sp. SCN 39-18]|nr:MBL fold metallo-hydrolase [Sphingobacteriales bacterium]ODT51917.1 MAG: Zn-dependent hydrolase [Niastella sp. SCN 39-18]OJW11537.1 MAG: MBL fold metallo-hydrolase [Sphingobacteriales bacterium 39-19]
MLFQHIYDKSLAQASYFIGCQKAGVAAVIDAKRDIDTYLEIAKANNMQITHIFETHIHADFLTGSRELAKLTDAKLYLSNEGGPGWQYEFPHQGLKDGDKIQVGNLSFEILHTPGHTPESISFLLTDNPASNKPVMLFTGDFVFVGDVGRPDLLEKAAGIAGTADEGAKQMYRSLQKFNALPDYVQVWPGHGAGSACGKALGAVPSTTVGYEKERNWAFQYANNEKGFVKYLLEDQPEPPAYFAMMKHLNKVDRPLLTEIPVLRKIAAAELKEALLKGIKLIDARPKTEFAGGFIPGSINIQGNNSFATWAGWLLKYDEPFIILAPEDQLNDLTRKLMRIGLDHIYGYVSSTQTWTEAGGALEKANILSLQETRELLAHNNVQLIDLRGAAEYNAGHIANAENVFVGTLVDNLQKINKNKNVIIYCQSGDRSSIGYSLLLKNGFKNIANFSGSIQEWVNAGEPIVT